MAVGLYCPDCGEFYGKDVENPMVVHCCNCGEVFYNERGDIEEYELDRDDMDWLLHNKPKVYRRLMKTTFQNFN